MQQTNFSFEVIIHDDASTDNTQQIIRSYAEKRPDLFRVVYQTDNQYSKGNSPGKFLLPMVRGKYVAFCEGDDFWTSPLKLQRQVDFLEENQEYSFCCHRFSIIVDDGVGRKSTQIEKEFASEYYKDNDLEINYELFFKTWATQPLTTMVRTNIGAEVFMTMSKFKYARDIHLFYLLLLKGKGISLNQNMGTYRRHKNGIETSLKGLEYFKLKHAVWKELYEEYPDDNNLKLKYIHALQNVIKRLPLKFGWKYYFKLLQVSPSLIHIIKNTYYLIK